MANEHSRSHRRTRRTSSTTRRDDLADWRRLTRPVILENFLNHTRDLRWSRELIDLLLDELHVSDEFDDLIGRVPPSAQVNYPQLVALALVLRHSWYPEDLARVVAEMAVEPSASAPAVDHCPSSEVIGSASRRSFADHATPSPHTCTPQEGEERKC
jgi:hypothetical protein